MDKKYSTIIRLLRKQGGFSQAEIAEQLGISRTSFISLEKGERDLSLDEASKFSRIFQISLEDLQAGRISIPKSIEVSKQYQKVSKRALEKYTERISVPQENMKKFKQVFLYILSKVGSKPNIGQTALYKLLYFIDFDYYEKFEEQLIGARYMKNTHGPTPVIFAKLVRELEEQGKLETVKSKFYKYEQTKFLINPECQVNLSELSAQELAHIDWELNRLSDLTATEISARSHADTPYQIAKEKDVLDYEAVFYRPEETSVREYEQL